LKQTILFLTAMTFTTGCEVVLVVDEDVSHPHQHEVCYVEPYAYAPEQCWEIVDHHDGYYEGECCEWDVGSGHFEDWCLWYDQCDWFLDYTGHYTYH